MNFIIGIVVFILGLIIFSFTVGNILLILLFGIPFTKKLEKVNLLRHNNIITSYFISLVIQVIVLFTITVIFYIFFLDNVFISLMIGYMFGLFGIIGKRKEFGLNINNFSDYVRVNKDCFWEEVIVKYNKDMDSFLEFVTRLIKYHSEQKSQV